MWNKIDRETYMQKVKGLKPIESFSDPDGTLHFGYGKPAMDTIWGIVGANDQPDQPIVKCEMRKIDRHQQEWNAEYFEYQKVEQQNKP